MNAMTEAVSASTKAVSASTTTTTVSCLFHLILVSGTVAVNVGRQHDRELQVLSEVLSGPAREKQLALHLDSALPEDVRRAVMDMEVVQRSLRHDKRRDLEVKNS